MGLTPLLEEQGPRNQDAQMLQDAATEQVLGCRLVLGQVAAPLGVADLGSAVDGIAVG
jgi:hypothetical protein